MFRIRTDSSRVNRASGARTWADLRYIRRVSSPLHTLDAPTEGATPVVVEVPHAGLLVPEAWRGSLEAHPRDVLRDADSFVDELVSEATADAHMR